MDYSAPDIALFSFIDKESIQSLNFLYSKFIFFFLPNTPLLQHSNKSMKHLYVIYSPNTKHGWILVYLLHAHAISLGVDLIRSSPLGATLTVYPNRPEISQPRSQP